MYEINHEKMKQFCAELDDRFDQLLEKTHDGKDWQEVGLNEHGEIRVVIWVGLRDQLKFYFKGGVIKTYKGSSLQRIIWDADWFKETNPLSAAVYILCVLGLRRVDEYQHGPFLD